MSVTFTEGRTQKPPFQGFRARALAQAVADNTPATFDWQRWTGAAESALEATLLLYFATLKQTPPLIRLIAAILGLVEGGRAVVKATGGV